VCQEIKRCRAQLYLLSFSWAAKPFFTGRIQSLHFARVIPFRFPAKRSVQSPIRFQRQISPVIMTFCQEAIGVGFNHSAFGQCGQHAQQLLRPSVSHLTVKTAE
jgi:hypothetical protein